MNPELVGHLDLTHLALEETALVAWEMGVVADMDAVARFLYHGGPHLPQNSMRPPRHFKLSEDDPRPDEKYWYMVKDELTLFLCGNDKKYKELWARINALESKSTGAIVVVVSGYLGERYGLHASVLAGFVAVFLYGVVKLGKEAYCRLASAETP